MSIAHRIGELYAAKMNAVLDRASDPGELADYSYAQLRDLLAEVHRSVAGVAVSRERAEQRMDRLRHAAGRLGEQAGQASEAGQHDLARQARARRSAILAEVSGLRVQHDGLLAEERKLSAAERRLRAKVEEFGARKEVIKAGYTVARARASIAEAFAGISGEVGDADLAAGRAEDQATGLEARAAALDSLLAPDAAALSDERLFERLDEISRRAQVEDELARLRERPTSRAGHRTVPHTADLRIEAWAPTREECLAEAVRGLVASFAVVAGLPPRARARRHLTARLDEDLLVAVIDEVIYRLDADGQIPASVTLRRAPDGGVVMFLVLVPVAQAEIIGATPKAASLHDLRIAADAAGRWSCGITVDV
jgi:phage shock protein A/SHS2 domain-containing protein